MFIQQRKRTFVRSYNTFGYIFSRDTGVDRVYDVIGSGFLAELSRDPQDCADVTQRVCARFPDVPVQVVEDRFSDFVEDLVAQRYILKGETQAALQEQEAEFGCDPAPPDAFETSGIKMDDSNYTDFMYDCFKKEPIPFRAYMDLTLACNVKCTHCYLPTIRNVKEMDLDLAKGVMDEMKEMGTLTIVFSGGEAILHRDVAELMRYAHECDLLITLLSNGTVFKEEHYELFKEIDMQRVQMTLFSLDPEIHDQITRKAGSHEILMRAINRLLEVGVPIKISCPILRVNRESCLDVSEWCYARDVPISLDFGIFACTDGDTGPLSTRLNAEEVETLVRQMMVRDEGYRECLELRDPERKPDLIGDKPTCGAANDTILVTSNGDYHFCTLFRKTLGNANRESLKEVWMESREMIELRQTTWKAFPQCMDCEAFHFCSMCFAKNYIHTGDHMEIDPHTCEMSFLNKRLVEEYWREQDVQASASSASPGISK